MSYTASVSQIGAAQMYIGIWFGCALALSSTAQAQEAQVLASSADTTALLRVAGDERRPLPAEFVKELQALQVQLIQLWNPPVGVKDAQELIVEAPPSGRPRQRAAGYRPWSALHDAEARALRSMEGKS